MCRVFINRGEGDDEGVDDDAAGGDFAGEDADEDGGDGGKDGEDDANDDTRCFLPSAHTWLPGGSPELRDQRADGALSLRQRHHLAAAGGSARLRFPLSLLRL